MLINRKQVAEVLGVKYSAIPYLDERGHINSAEVSYSEKGTPVYWYDKDTILEYKANQEQKKKRLAERALRNKRLLMAELISVESSIDNVEAGYFIRRPYLYQLTGDAA